MLRLDAFACKKPKGVVIITCAMNGNAGDGSLAHPDEERRAQRRRRGSIVIICGVIVAAIDTLLSCWVIPWVDRQEWAVTRYGSVGYVVFFVMVFFTFIAFVALVAYYFSRQSYPSDEWR